MIPKILHQIWIGPRPRPTYAMDSWREKHPGWRYELWDDARAAAFGFHNAAKIAQAAEWCGRADIMRYEILARHGGVYVDADAVCLRPLDGPLLEPEVWCCYESERARPGLLSNGYLGAAPGCPLMHALVGTISAADVSPRAGRAWRTTGPGLLTRIARGYTPLRVFPSYLFIPRHYTGLEQRGPEPPYAEQLWGSTRDAYERDPALGAAGRGA